MQPGTVCRCIKYFKGMSTDELSLEIGDIVQVHQILDKIWLEGQSNDLYGKFPSNSVIEEDIPDVTGNASLFVAANEFTGSEPGDLCLYKGHFVVGIRAIDESWWFGKCMGKEGMFPINFVWAIDQDLLKSRNTGEEPVSFYVKAKTSLKAQLPEELSLNAGDIVKVTHIVDKDWYRGEINNSQGIFPKAFVEIVDFAVLPDENEDQFLQEKPNEILCEPESSHIPVRNEDTGSLFGDVIAPYGRAIFTFIPASSSELAFTKGDTIQLVKHIDSFWMLGRRGDAEGTFPTSYVQIIVDCPRPHPIEFNAHKEDIPSTTPDPYEAICSEDTSHETEVIWSTQTKPICLSDNSVYSNVVESGLDTAKEDVETKSEIPIENIAEDLPEGSHPRISYSESVKPPVHDSSYDSEQTPSAEIPLAETRKNDDLDNQVSEKISQHSHREEEDFSSSSSSPASSAKRSHSPEAPKANENMRRYLVKELIETEHEYIHDLESFVQVVHVSRNIREAAAVEIDILLGNITEVIEFSKHFLKNLHRVCFNDDENMVAGTVFLECSERLCEVYKVYSSHHSLIVQPALQKYQAGGDSLAYLEYVLKELRQHKIKLMDMGAVLMKPVQRVLKYPLFIERLIGSTSPDHKDFQCLQEAKFKMQLVAKDINDYTKRMDLVKKYKSSSGHSLEFALQKMSVHSVAKKGSRLKTRLSATIGLFSQAKDPQFEEEVFQYRSMVKAANGILVHGEKLMSVIDARHLAELNVVEALASAYVVAPSQPLLEQARNAARDNYNRLLTNFKATNQRRVLEPLKILLRLCCGPDRLLLKRSDKLLDFNQTEQRLERNRDPTKTRILEEEHLNAKGIFEAIHTQLHYDLPKLTSYGVELLRLAMKTLVGLRMQLQGQLASSVLQVSTNSEIATSDTESLEERIKARLRAELSVLRDLEFLPLGFVPDSPLRKRKSTVYEPPESLISQTTPQSIVASYPPNSLYVVTGPCSSDSALDLSAKTGEIIAVIKEKDPTGRPDRWFVDNGKEKGFISSVHLRKLSASEISNMRPQRKLSNTARPVEATDHSSARGGSSGLPMNVPCGASASYPSGESNLPRYEDLYGIDNPSETVYEEVPEYQPYSTTEESHIYEELPENLDDDNTAPTKREIYQNIDSDDNEDPPDQFYYALYPFKATSSNQLSLDEGQAVLLLSADDNGWWFVQNRRDEKGYVPSTYLSKYT